MTLIRVDPDSVRSYGRGAQAAFDAMHQALVGLVDQLVAVRYFGPNSVVFKTQCGQMAADFANRLHLDMSAMADAVRTSTSNIAAALGGQPIHLHIDARPIVPPQPLTVDYVDVDTSALESMVPVVNRHFTQLRHGLGTNLRLLQATDWEGFAKIAAVDAVTGFTTSASAACQSSVSGAKLTKVASVEREISSCPTCA